MRARARSIVVPMVLLVVVAVAIATAVQFAITFMGPPPFTPPVPIEQVAKGLREGAAERRFESRLDISSAPIDPETINGWPSPQRDAIVAKAMGVPAGEVHGFYQLVRGPARDFMRNEIRGDFAIAWQSPSGLRVARSRPAPMFTTWHKITLASTLGVLLLLAGAAWLVARAISRPIRNLATAANAARLGNRTPIPQDGPLEVRELAQALEAMQGRILEAAEGRTAMLAAIVHDLGTPLSRIAFRIEQLPEAERDRAAADVGEMREMLGEVLRFVRDSRSTGASERIDLASLIESLADDMRDGGMDVRVTPGPGIVVPGNSQALRRLLANLIDNGVRYGKSAAITWSAAPGWAEILIDDGGPGFPDNAEALFAPFVRGESSRNRATGGTGLGLSIVRSIAEAHGGSVVLENVAGGGRARVRLPAE